MRDIRIALLSMAILAAGCVGEPVGRSGPGSDLVEAPPPNALPLEDLGSDAWERAPAGCEGRLELDQPVTFRVASARDGLVAAIDGEGRIVCVDTLEAVQDELAAQGDDEQAEELGDRFRVAVMIDAAPALHALTAADPTPQPNCPELGAARNGEPTPQPNLDPR